MSTKSEKTLGVGGWSRWINAWDDYFKAGLTFPERTTSDFSPRVLPLMGYSVPLVRRSFFLTNYSRRCITLPELIQDYFKLVAMRSWVQETVPFLAAPQSLPLWTDQSDACPLFGTEFRLVRRDCSGNLAGSMGFLY